MLNGIVKIQSELFREMAKTQTSELSSIITLALKESQQLSTQSIITAIKEMQKENLKFLQAHPVVYTAPAAQAVPEDYHVSPVPRAEPLRPLPDEEINAAPAAPVIQTTDISREIFGDDTEDNDDTEIIAGGEEIAVQKKKKKKKKKKKNSEGLSLDSLASSLFDKVSTLTDKVSNLSGKKNQKEEDPAEKAANDFSFPEKQEASNGGLDFSLFDNDVPSAAAEPEKTAELSKILPPMKTNGSMSKFRQKKFCPNFSRSKPLKRKNRSLRNSLPRFLRTMTTGDIIRQRKNFRQKIFLPNR